MGPGARGGPFVGQGSAFPVVFGMASGHPF